MPEMETQPVEIKEKEYTEEEMDKAIDVLIAAETDLTPLWVGQKNINEEAEIRYII